MASLLADPMLTRQPAASVVATTAPNPPPAVAATSEFFDGNHFGLQVPPSALPQAQAELEAERARRTEVLAIIQQTDGTAFAGDVFANAPSGWGIFSQPNGTRLEGEWRRGVPYKIKGRVVLPGSIVEEGTWDYVSGTGSGTITWRDGHTYAGTWKVTSGFSEECPDGAGTMAWPDGHKFVGHFRDGKMDGPGTMTWPDGKVVHGTWLQDEFRMSRIGP
ncbi:MAG TPA: hypothetical protein VMV72_10105 [Verrucomicrobiae bacterium]|nr:hypothetical protein [Verrucomicrobiae bacterium]